MKTLLKRHILSSLSKQWPFICPFYYNMLIHAHFFHFQINWNSILFQDGIFKAQFVCWAKNQALTLLTPKIKLCHLKWIQKDRKIWLHHRSTFEFLNYCQNLLLLDLINSNLIEFHYECFIWRAGTVTTCQNVYHITHCKNHRKTDHIAS